MKFTNVFKMGVFPVLVLCVFILTACAVRTPVKQISSIEASKNLKYENIIFKVFKTMPGLDGHVSSAEALAKCKISVMSYLDVKGIFKRVEKDTGKSYDEPSLYVDVTLTNLRILSNTARIWAGVFAGRSNMNLNVKLTASDGSLIAEKDLVGAPNAWGSMWSSSDENLPKNMGYLLGDYIISNAIR